MKRADNQNRKARNYHEAEWEDKPLAEISRIHIFVGKSVCERGKGNTWIFFWHVLSRLSAVMSRKTRASTIVTVRYGQ